MNQDLTNKDLKTTCDAVADYTKSWGDPRNTPPPLYAAETKRKKKSCGCLVFFGAFAVIAGLFLFFVMLRPFVYMAQYTAEAMPVIGNLRTKIEVYRLENGHLPGLRHNAEGISVTTATEGVDNTSRLGEKLSLVQTWSDANPAVFTEDFSKVVAVTNGNHVFRELDIATRDATRHKLRPRHLQYRIDACEKGEKYIYAVGVFGDGDGLKTGTGYAVLEFNDPATPSKRITTWERYKPVAAEQKQIVMVNVVEARKYFKCETPEQAMQMNLCWMGDTEALMSGDKARVEKALEELWRAGWTIN